MSDYSNTKNMLGAVYPTGIVDSTWGRLEPLLSPEQLVQRYLPGIPLQSQTSNPFTGLYDIYHSELVRDRIIRGVSQAESELDIFIMPVQKKERHPFDYHDFQAGQYFIVESKPIVSVESISIVLPNGVTIFDVPDQWIDPGRFHAGQINVLPIAFTPSSAAVGNTVNGSSAMFLSLIAKTTWQPAFYTVTYTTGFPNGMLPVVVNDFIGCLVALDILSELAATRSNTSASLGIDGLSQSVGGPGPQLYSARIQQLEEKRARLAVQIKNTFGANWVMGHV